MDQSINQCFEVMIRNGLMSKATILVGKSVVSACKAGALKFGLLHTGMAEVSRFRPRRCSKSCNNTCMPPCIMYVLSRCVRLVASQNRVGRFMSGGTGSKTGLGLSKGKWNKCYMIISWYYSLYRESSMGLVYTTVCSKFPIHSINSM